MKKIKLFSVAAFLLAVGAAFAGNRPTNATIYEKIGGVCTLNCQTAVSSTRCVNPLFSTLIKCQNNQSDITTAYRVNP